MLFVPLLCIKATFVHIIVTNIIGVTDISVVFGMHYLRTDRLVDRSNLRKLPLPHALVASTTVLSVVEMYACLGTSGLWPKFASSIIQSDDSIQLLYITVEVWCVRLKNLLGTSDRYITYI